MSGLYGKYYMRLILKDRNCKNVCNKNIVIILWWKVFSLLFIVFLGY